MSQRISLDQNEFAKLVRGEIVTQGSLQVALHHVGTREMYSALADAVAGAPECLLGMSLREDTEEVRRWIHGLNQHEPTRPGDFLLAFAAAVCRADDCNYPLLRPAILALMQKYSKYRFTGVL